MVAVEIGHSLRIHPVGSYLACTVSFELAVGARFAATPSLGLWLMPCHRLAAVVSVCCSTNCHSFVHATAVKFRSITSVPACGLSPRWRRNAALPFALQGRRGPLVSLVLAWSCCWGGSQIFGFPCPAPGPVGGSAARILPTVLAVHLLPGSPSRRVIVKALFWQITQPAPGIHAAASVVSLSLMAIASMHAIRALARLRRLLELHPAGCSPWGFAQPTQELSRRSDARTQSGRRAQPSLSCAGI